MNRLFSTTNYRYPNEQLILWGTLLLVCGVIAFTATATLCLSFVVVAGMVLSAYVFSQQHHQELMVHATQIDHSSNPDLVGVIDEAAQRLQVEPINVFVLPSRDLNAYTFGLSSPKVIVLHEALFRIMDRDEVQFILGHEMGHIHLGHTWLNSLVGGMAGIPAGSGASLLLVLALRSWNRACEFSADRAGLLACNNPQKAVTALLKLEAKGASAVAMQQTLERLDAQDEQLGANISEMLATHPMIIKRIDELRRFAASADYQKWQASMNQNIQIAAS